MKSGTNGYLRELVISGGLVHRFQLPSGLPSDTTDNPPINLLVERNTVWRAGTHLHFFR